MDIKWLLLAILFFLLYRIIIGTSAYFIVKFNNERVSLLKMIQINFIILFFHGITPFAGGGQPMEIYYLHNEKIDTMKATNITLQNFIVYQTALIIVNILALIYNQIFSLFPNDSLMRKLVVIGFVINFTIWIVSFLISFSKKLNNFIVNNVLNFLAKIRIVKNKDKMQDKLNKYVNRFHTSALLLKKQKKKCLVLILLNVIAIYSLYSVAYAVCMGMGINEFSPAMIAVMITYVSIIGSFVPIPGGTGGIEFSFMYFFSFYIKGGILNAIMLTWRFITYYLAMIIGAIALSIYRKKDKE